MRQSLRINQYIFQSTLSVRRATLLQVPVTLGDMISIHALREESDMRILDRKIMQLISIHALREESDHLDRIESAETRDFNPRSP